MAYPNDLSRTKNWGNEVLTDADLEGQLDLIITWLMASLDATSGHKHDATTNEGPKIATGGLDLSTITQNLVMTSKILKLAKGADVASAAGNIVLGDDGNYFDITGVLAITSITIKTAGTVVTLQFDSTASMVDGGNLKLNGSFLGAAESQITLISDGTNWFEVSRQVPEIGRIVQVVNVMDGTLATGNTAMPDDDTIPQITEGTEFMTLAITPTSATNKLKIDVVFQGSADAHIFSVALFQDATAGALAAIYNNGGGAGNAQVVTFSHYMDAGTVSATTFRVRMGGSSGNYTMNGQDEAQKLGGIMASSITITEIKA